MWEFLKGKKTYLIGALMIALGLLNGNMEMVLQGIGFMTVRHALPIAK
jgi:hypothetical protein